MKAKRIVIIAVLVLAAAVFASTARAETLSWNAVTTYTDGTTIPTGTAKTYTAYWTTDSALTPSTLQTLASAITATSTTFSIGSAGMPRGSVIYFTVKATVGGVDSALATALSWNVPTLSPSSPSNLRIQ